MRSKEELDTYLNSWSEGDNITVTADCLNMLEAASKDLEILEIFKKYFAGISEENGRYFIDMTILEPQDIAFLISLINKGVL